MHVLSAWPKERNALKNLLEKISLIIGIIIGLPILLIACIGYLFYVPFDIIRYHKMPYYKDLRKKYVFLITSRDTVKFYNYITNENLPIEYFINEDYEYFVKDEEVLLCGWSKEEFEKEGEEWSCIYAGNDKDRSMSTQEIIELDRVMLRPEHKDLPVKILVLCNKKELEKLEQMKECPYFYVVSL